MYGQGVNHQGITEDLALDLHPAVTGEPKPFMVLRPRRQLRAGNRTSLTDEAIEYAQLGYVAATIDYRTGPRQGDLLAGADRPAPTGS